MPLVYFVFVFLFFSRFIFTRIYVAFSPALFKCEMRPQRATAKSQLWPFRTRGPRQHLSSAKQGSVNNIRNFGDTAREAAELKVGWLALGLALFAAIETCTKCFINTHAHARTDTHTHHNRLAAAVAGRQSSNQVGLQSSVISSILPLLSRYGTTQLLSHI